LDAMCTALGQDATTCYAHYASMTPDLTAQLRTLFGYIQSHYGI
ncbi:MAG: hypothetical protein FD127_4334, partial [Acidimicrobiaceae bacterium]